ncbi:MAG: prolipoprotein diacylglyceryl transferase [Acutalibacteraceae bacterium]
MCPYIYIVLPSYAVMAFIGGFAILIFTYFRLDKYKIQFTYFLKLFLISAIACFIGSKILFMLTQLPELFKNFSFQNSVTLIAQSGFVFYGGLFGIIFALYFYTRKDKDLQRRVIKLIVPAVPLFHSFGRIGCFLAGCCYGKEIEPHFVIGDFIEFSRIPVPLFEAVFEFLIFGIILIIEKKRPNCDTLAVYLISYAVFRFCNEFFRGDEIRGIFFGLSTSQWISLFIVIFYACKFIAKRKKTVKEN